MSNHFTMMSHYMLAYNSSHQMMAVPIPDMCKKAHVEDTICSNINLIPVTLTLNVPLYLQQPNQPTAGRFAKFMVITVVALWGLLNIVTLYTILRDHYLSTDQNNPQFCIRSASASYY